MKDFGKITYKVIHVGGTNGKGSVCQLIGNVLMKKYKVGIYTSPHLQRVNERIVVDVEEIRDEEIESYSFLKKYNLTYFEALTSIAIKYFNDKGVDFAIFEVGLGGRLDATNVLEPFITIITNVSKEHEHFLGNRIEDIANEKAGIIKNAPVITACKGKALDIIKRKAKERKVDLYIVGKHIKWKRIRKNVFLIEGDERYEIYCPLNGIFQGENLAIAVKACELLGIEKEKILEGIKNVRWKGRMEKIGKYLLDGAHNPEAIKRFAESIHDFEFKKLIIVFGAMKDKNIKGMVKNLPHGIVIATTAKNRRSMPAHKIAEILKSVGRECIVAKDIKEAIKIANKLAGREDLICITGSLYLVGEAIKEIYL